MKVLVLNCGSSSIKYQLFDMTKKEVLTKGGIEKIGLHGSFLRNHRSDGDKVKLVGEVIDHQAGIEYILGVLISKKHGAISNLDEIDAVGHRVVHGAERFKSSVLIDEEVIDKIEECIDLAPLHNPPNLKGIEAIQAILPDIPQVAVFDTAFHQTMPNYAYMYAIPYSLYKKHGLRRYGFHGSSHRYVSQRACEILGFDFCQKKIITCHLGNGASITAIKNGKSIDTSMGLTPVEGLMMGTRSGDLDLGVLTHIIEKEEININVANTLVNKHSGILGVSGISSDMREVNNAAQNGNERAQLAIKMYCYRIKKYIGSYIAALGGLDLLVFTGGIGENATFIREEVCRDMDYLGIAIDYDKNTTVHATEDLISSAASKVNVIVVPTNEEYIIAQDTMEIIMKQKEIAADHI
jgi:acetate kinase